MDQRAIDLYDKFTHGHINRRDFFDRLTAVAGSSAAATAIYTTLRPDYAQAAIIEPTDARLVSETTSFDTPAGKLSGYLVRPKSKGKRPAVVVIHENRGLNPHIQDVARRLAVEGFLAFAPDFLSHQGGTPPDDDKAREMFGKIDLAIVDQQGVAAVKALNAHAESSGKTGAIGFCWGGGTVDRLALNSPDLSAAVAYYGPVPRDLSRVKDIKAPLLLHYAGLDANVNPGIPAFEAALKESGKKYTIHMYDGVNHAFNNDTGGPRYDKAAADLAWSRTLAFFKENVGTPPST
jgi:carboxymethylenebutenolidase